MAVTIGMRVARIAGHAHVVNLDFVRAFRRATRGQLVAEMSDGARLPVSRSRAQELRHPAV